MEFTGNGTIQTIYGEIYIKAPQDPHKKGVRLKGMVTWKSPLVCPIRIYFFYRPFRAANIEELEEGDTRSDKLTSLAFYNLKSQLDYTETMFVSAFLKLG